jgi:hypothetical protein
MELEFINICRFYKPNIHYLYHRKSKVQCLSADVLSNDYKIEKRTVTSSFHIYYEEFTQLGLVL